MARSDFLDREVHYCKACKKSYCIQDLTITQASYGFHNRITIHVTCPKKHRMAWIIVHRNKDKKAIEEYLESVKVPLK